MLLNIVRVCIVISIISFTVETIPGLSDNTHAFIDMVEIVCVAVFSLEYIYNIYKAERKFKYVLSFYGLIDLFSIVPTFIGLSQGTQAIKIVRLVRLIKLLDSSKYGPAYRQFKKAFLIAKNEFLLFLVGILILLYVTSVCIYYFVKKAQPEVFASIPHAMWWSIVTLTTVGYGDIYPVTV